MFAIFRKELRSYFITPTGYIFMSLFLLLSGIFFVTSNLFTMSSSYNARFLASSMFIFMMVSPVLTMKLFCDEQRNKTDQLLLTSPIRIIDIVMGKFLAAWTIFLLSLAVTVFYAFIVAAYGDLVISETVGGYLGFMLIGACFISIGLFISSTTENQVVAALVTFGALLFMWLMEMVMDIVPTDQFSGAVFASLIGLCITAWLYFSTKNAIIGASVLLAISAFIGISFTVNQALYAGFTGRVLQWFSILTRFPDFMKGYIRFSHLVYYLSFSGFFLFLTVRVIEKKRWS